MYKILIALGLIGTTVIGGWAYYGVTASITLNNPQKISWIKPTTDSGWAEDVKAENFDIKSTEVLQEMRDNHAAKLQRIIDGNKKLTECPVCARYDIRQNLSQQEGIENLDVSVENEYQNQLSQYLWDMEKLTQSVERMDNEIRLRAKGFVVPDKNRAGVKTKQTDLDKVDLQFVRKIND